MFKKPLSEREELLSKGSRTFEHRDETGRPPEAIYSGDGHDRMDCDLIARANHGKESKSSTPFK